MQSTAYAAIEAGADLGVFAVLSLGDTSKSASDLARATGADLEFFSKNVFRDAAK